MVFVLSFPKDRLWAWMQSRWEPVRIEAKKVEDLFVWLEIVDGEIFLERMRVGEFERAKIFPYIFLNGAVVQKPLSPYLRNVAPQEVYGLYSIFYPVRIFLWIKMADGVSWGYIDIPQKKLVLHLGHMIPSLGIVGAKVSKEKKGYRVEIDLGP
jgi:hypothetical protein